MENKRFGYARVSTSNQSEEVVDDNCDDYDLESSDEETLETWENENNFEELMKDYIENEQI